MHLSLLFAGDILIHGPVARAARRNDGSFDFSPMFAEVAPIIGAADVAICHMETPIDDDNRDIDSYPMFYVPHEIAAAIKGAGFDGCSTASNHSLDHGAVGIRTTLEALDEQRLGHAGTGRNALEAASPAIYVTKGVRIAHLSYSYGMNGMPLPADQPWAENLIDVDRIVADAQAARAAGARVVVVSLHWGVEYQFEPTESQRRIADAVLASGAVDLIVGHHAHVPQPIEKLDPDHWTVFGLGNLLSNQTDRCCSPASQDGVIVRADLDVPPGGRAKTAQMTFTPVRVDHSNGFVVVPVGEALHDPRLAGSMGRQELLESLARTTAVVARTPSAILVPSTTL